MYRSGVLVVLAGLAAALSAATASAQEGYREVTVSNGAVISGEAVYAGAPPGPFVVWVKKDAAVLGEKVPDDRIVVSRTGKVANVVMALVGIREGKPWPDRRAQLNNKGGRFLPHVQIVRAGAQLEIVNRDPVLHNTHGYQDGRTVFNLAQPTIDQVIKRPLRRPGLIDIMCDSHDWMSAWIVVQDHPYVAVTGEDGTYAIPDVPPGTYTLTAWHEKLGRQQHQVTVKAKEQKKVSVTFPAK